MREEEFLFACGLVCMAAAAGLCQFVMIGLIGVALFPAAVALLVIGGLRARATEASPLRIGLGIALLMLGIALLIGTAYYTSSLSFNLARMINKPTAKEWGILGICSLFPPILMALSLRVMADWSCSRSVLWGIGVFCVAPATILIFQVCATFFPLSA